MLLDKLEEKLLTITGDTKMKLKIKVGLFRSITLSANKSYVCLVEDYDIWKGTTVYFEPSLNEIKDVELQKLFCTNLEKIIKTFEKEKNKIDQKNISDEKARKLIEKRCINKL